MLTQTDRRGRKRQVAEWLNEGVEAITSVQLKCLSDDEIELLHGNLGSLVRGGIAINVDGGVARPERRAAVSESTSRYRASVAAYIKSRTGVEIPVSSTVPCTFYNAVADLVERLAEE